MPEFVHLSLITCLVWPCWAQDSWVVPEALWGPSPRQVLCLALITWHNLAFFNHFSKSWAAWNAAKGRVLYAYLLFGKYSCALEKTLIASCFVCSQGKLHSEAPEPDVQWHWHKWGRADSRSTPCEYLPGRFRQWHLLWYFCFWWPVLAVLPTPELAERGLCLCSVQHVAVSQGLPVFPRHTSEIRFHTRESCTVLPLTLNYL